MGKNPAGSKPARPPGAAEAQKRLRAIPSVERYLSSEPFAGVTARYGRETAKSELGTILERVRGELVEAPSAGEAASEVAAAIESRRRPSLRPVVNATGVIIHTNLGRSPIDPGLWDEAGWATTRYSNLEFDLHAGERGRRDDHLAALGRELLGAEATILTNNNAAAVLLVLATLAPGKEVVVSRGELVEIGGGFRVPEVIVQGGARLREVGTTNRTRAEDYDAACGDGTGAILKVSRSNFAIVGFTEMPQIEQLAAVARGRGVPLVYDEGSGTVADIGRYGFSGKPSIRELFACGVDVITCSTDKLMGATQGGLIAGRADLVQRCARHPLMRALRGGKESYAVIAATLRAFLDGTYEEKVPVYRMLAASPESLRERAEALAGQCGGEPVRSRAVLGGGTTPGESIDSWGVALAGQAAQRHAALLNNDPPIVARIEDDRVVIDMRTVDPDEDALVAHAASRR
jgi:L-seryl-tRNA(Ser) seleniumtransferase